jgi:RNA polymerase sigma-70 factor (ECF subfamily)
MPTQEVPSGVISHRDQLGPGDPISDRSLLSRFCVGNPDAARAIYDRYAGRLRALARAKCSARLSRRVDAEDIVQSVFRRFFQAAARGNYQVPAGEDLWDLLLVITTNRIRTEETFHRAAKRDIRLTDEIDFDEPSQVCRGGQDDFSAAFLDLAVKEVLERLPERYRGVVELRMAGCEVAEIARQTGRSKRTVERQLQESRSRLTTLLTPDE